MSVTMDSQLRALRRYAALLLGSKALADDHLEKILHKAAPNSTAMDLYRLLHEATSPEPILRLDDFAERDRHLLAALHKLPVADRSLLLLSSTAPFGDEHIAALIGSDARQIGTNLQRAQKLLQASFQNRLCMIVEDDLIALRDLKGELTQEKLGVAGTAKNQREAFGLSDTIRPDIAIIDLALPEGATAGADVAERLRKRFSTKIIFVTAFAKIAETLAGPGDMIVPKPWSAGSLKHAITAATG